MVFESIYSSKPAAMFSLEHNSKNPEKEVCLKDLHERSLTIIAEKLPVFDMVNKKMCAAMGARSLIEVNDRTTAHEFIRGKNAYACVVNCAPAYEKIPFFSYAKVVPIVDAPFLFEVGWVYRKDTYHSDLAVEFIREVEGLFMI
ncbi:hypothetical protein H9X85_06000 [Anaerotignum lactatifermentans]|nr:hypothetical protein [Anaerotignum lactatifermentans]MBM6950766.1 hypothetical protein [Anaerotignum lactatifermentans]